LAGDKAEAEKYLRMCIANEFKAEQVYLDILHMYGQDEADADKYKATLAEAREKYPNNQDIIHEEINIYLAAKEEAETELKAALPFLEKAHAIDPTDIQTMSSLKVIYARTNQMDKFDAIKEKLEN
jgi:hypothetical protein